MSSVTRLLWFRRDLRLHDLPALLEAGGDDADVLACYVLDPRLKSRQARGACSSSTTRCASCTTRSTASSWSPEVGPRREYRTWPTQSARHPCTSPRTSRRSGHTATTRSARRSVTSPCNPLVRRTWCRRGVWSRTTANPTRCSRRTTGAGSITGGGAPRNPARRRHTGSTPPIWRGAAKNFDIPDPGTPLSIPAGETAARRHWKRFAERHLADYADNRDRPDLDATSRMSAYLHFGNIHPRTLAVDLERRGRRAAGVSAGAGVPRLLRRCAGGVAAERVVELQHGLRPDRGR